MTDWRKVPETRSLYACAEGVVASKRKDGAFNPIGHEANNCMHIGYRNLNGKTSCRQAAKMVLEAFGQAQPGRSSRVIFHDGDKMNSSLDNIAWASQDEFRQWRRKWGYLGTEKRRNAKF